VAPQGAAFLVVAQFRFVLKGHDFQSLRKNSLLHLILGGAADNLTALKTRNLLII